jgi:hypothetical protein
MDACMFDNDATGCYDRMIPSIVMLKFRRAGMPPSATKVVRTVLQRMHYYVCTAYGISTEAFSNLVDYILGIIQGSGHAGAGWALTSSVMLDKMDNTTGATFHSPRPNQSCRRTGEAFVDDSTLWLLQMEMILATAIQLMRQSTQRWERLLYATGGALNRAKCYWYGIQWYFTPTGHCQMLDDPDDNDPIIQLTAGTDPDTLATIQRINTSTGKRTLGIRLSPTGNDRDEYHYRIQQAKNMQQ